MNRVHQSRVSTHRLLPLAALMLGLSRQAAYADPAPPAPNALPQGGAVVAGNVNLGAPAGNQLTVTQTSQRGVINWSSFDIGAQGKVQFVQPNAQSSTLNRVISPDPTQIFGQLTANGQLYIVNPSGVVFGAGSRVDAGALVASTLDIADSDFMAGNNRFVRNGATGSIINHGAIKAARGGYVALLGATVANTGSLGAEGGSVILAAGDGIRLPVSSSGLITLEVDPATANTTVVNSPDGVIAAPGGQVYLSAAAASGLVAQVLNQGRIDASDGGKVTLSAVQADGLGETRQEGLIDVSSAQGVGGSVNLLGDRVGLFADSRVLATGATGGGTVLVGGNYQGKGPEHNAHAVYMSSGAAIDASAMQNGNGGKVILWSQDYTGFYGQIAARGGAAGGNGGFVETSSHNNLQAFGQVSADAPAGLVGSWLLDPTNVTIVAGAVDSNETNAAGTWNPTATGAQIGVTNINTALNAGTSVTVNTASGLSEAGNIVQNAGAGISKTVNNASTLTMNAAGSITLNGSINATTGALVTTLNAAGGGVGGSGAITTNGGLLTINAAGNGTLSGAINLGTGGLTHNGAGTTTLSNTVGGSGATTINNGTLIISNTSAGPRTYAEAVTVNSGATLGLAGTQQISLNAGLTLNTGSTLSDTGTNTATPSLVAGGLTTINGTVAINIAGADHQLFLGTFTGGRLAGAGTINLANTGNANTGLGLRNDSTGAFSGTINVNGGGLYIANSSNAALQNATVNLANSAKLSLAGVAGLAASPASIKSLNSLAAANATVVLGAQTLTLGTNNGSGNFAGVISGTGNLVKSGTGTQILTGTNLYTGTTTVSGGTLQVGNGGTSGTLGSGAVTDNANLFFTRSDTYSIANAITGSGSLTATSGAGLTIGGPITLTDNIKLTACSGCGVVPGSVANGSVTGGDVTLNNTVSSTGTNKTVTIYSGNATTAAYTAQVAGSATSLNKAYATAPGTGTVDQSKKLNVFYRVSPTATVNAVANNRIYDATTAATVNTVTSTVTGIDGDNLVVSGSTASFADKNVGSGKTVAVSGISVASNTAGVTINGYQVANTATTANITPAALTLTAATDSRTYDATTSSLGAPIASGLLGGDTVTGLSQSFANKNAGTNKTLLVNGGYAVNDGNSGGNYAVTTVNNTTGVITPAALALTAVTDSRAYDGTTNSSGAPLVSGLFGSDTVTGLNQSFANKNGGTNKTLLVNNSYGINDGNGGGNYTVTAVANNTGVITPVALTVWTNNDAKFVTKSDVAGYNGASYTGFVNGETPSVLGGNLAIVRTNAGTNESAGTYAGVLQGSGLTSSNYTINYAAGTYTIVPANQLLVRLSNVSSTYGTAANFGVQSAQYMLSDGTVVSLNPVLNNGQVAVNDGVGGNVQFDIVPSGAATSSSGNLRAGNYQLAAANITGNSSDFSNTLTVVGAQTVDARTVNISPGGVSKTYDGTVGTTGLTLNLNNLLAGDILTVDGSGAFGDKNAGTGKGYTLRNLILSGADAANYLLVGGASTFTGNDGVITRRAITVTAPGGVTKLFDGNVSVPSRYLPVVSGGVGEGVRSASLAYATPAVGTDKTVNVSDVVMDDGNGGQNYAVTFQASNTGSIAPLPSPLPVLTTIERTLPTNILLADVGVAVARDGRLARNVIELNDIRSQFPEIMAIISVASMDGTVLPAGTHFDPRAGRLGWEEQAKLPSYLMATALDRNNALRQIRIRIKGWPEQVD